VVFVGNGSSYFVARLAARSLRRYGFAADALAASDVDDDLAARGACVVALSQSGRSGDILDAIARLAPARLIAVTNGEHSPLAAAAALAFSVGAGPEEAVPASKSVTAMGALVLQAALRLGTGSSHAAELTALADDLEGWLGGACESVAPAVEELARRQNIVVAGGGDGVPVAGELALKLKEAAYRRAEGVAAGEFRHGSTAMLDRSSALVALIGAEPERGVVRLLEETAATGCAQIVVGGAFGDRLRVGIDTRGPFAALAWIASGQVLALELGRRDGIDGDAPRGLQKVVD
jgi:glucosamine--fructose-6-phosphate aminotransferase (isomerizing)